MASGGSLPSPGESLPPFQLIEELGFISSEVRGGEQSMDFSYEPELTADLGGGGSRHMYAEPLHTLLQVPVDYIRGI